jgi:hypothetical protein
MTGVRENAIEKMHLDSHLMMLFSFFPERPTAIHGSTVRATFMAPTDWRPRIGAHRTISGLFLQRACIAPLQAEGSPL